MLKRARKRNLLTTKQLLPNNSNNANSSDRLLKDHQTLLSTIEKFQERVRQDQERISVK